MYGYPIVGKLGPQFLLSNMVQQRHWLRLVNDHALAARDADSQSIRCISSYVKSSTSFTCEEQLQQSVILMIQQCHDCCINIYFCFFVFDEKNTCHAGYVQSSLTSLIKNMRVISCFQLVCSVLLIMIISFFFDSFIYCV